MTCDKVLGTPVICPECKTEDKIRLFRGVHLKNTRCISCGHVGVKRNTSWEKRKERGMQTET